MRKVTATELQRHARDVIDQVRISREPVVVENRGKAMAAVVPYEEYEELLRYRKKRDEDFERFFAAAEANAAANGYPSEDEAMEMANRLIHEYREERRRQVSA